MKAIAITVRRSALAVAGSVVVRAGVALGYTGIVLASAGLGLWLLISLPGLSRTATGG